MHGWMDGWMDGCMYVCMYVCMYKIYIYIYIYVMYAHIHIRPAAKGSRAWLRAGHFALRPLTMIRALQLTSLDVLSTKMRSFQEPALELGISAWSHVRSKTLRV